MEASRIQEQICKDIFFPHTEPGKITAAHGISWRRTELTMTPRYDNTQVIVLLQTLPEYKSGSFAHRSKACTLPYLPYQE